MTNNIINFPGTNIDRNDFAGKQNPDSQEKKQQSHEWGGNLQSVVEEISFSVDNESKVGVMPSDMGFLNHVTIFQQLVQVAMTEITQAVGDDPDKAAQSLEYLDDLIDFLKNPESGA